MNRKVYPLTVTDTTTLLEAMEAEYNTLALALKAIEDNVPFNEFISDMDNKFGTVHVSNSSNQRWTVRLDITGSIVGCKYTLIEVQSELDSLKNEIESVDPAELY